MMEDAGKRARSAFQIHFGRPPRWLASAPGRGNLIGEFTDFNDGVVVPRAVERRPVLAAAPNVYPDKIVLRSEATGETVTVNLAEVLRPESKGRWANYPKGVLA